ncbi:MAG: hypothetical protein MEQ84_00385 [Mesorhizobium sp.]|nr:hypothetical protein [Mesorhizobium sp.]
MAAAVQRDQPVVVGQQRGQRLEIVPAPQAAMQQDDRLAIRPARLRHEQRRIADRDHFAVVEHASPRTNAQPPA